MAGLRQELSSCLRSNEDLSELTADATTFLRENASRKRTAELELAAEVIPGLEAIVDKNLSLASFLSRFQIEQIKANIPQLSYSEDQTASKIKKDFLEAFWKMFAETSQQLNDCYSQGSEGFFGRALKKLENYQIRKSSLGQQIKSTQEELLRIQKRIVDSMGIREFLDTKRYSLYEYQRYSEIPMSQNHGVYLIWEGPLLYIGESRQIQVRLQTHTVYDINKNHYIGVVPVGTRTPRDTTETRQKVERMLIEEYNPLLNRAYTRNGARNWR